MSKNISIELTEKSIDKAIKELKAYRDHLNDLCEALAQRLGGLGCDIAIKEIADFKAVFSGELLESIDLVRGAENGTFFVVADSEHAAFVEFGTGWVGDANPYPYELPDGVTWNYVTGEQILTNAQKGIYGWFYPNPDGEGYLFTEGMEARPFMHNTAVKLAKQAPKIAREVFNNGR